MRRRPRSAAGAAGLMVAVERLCIGALALAERGSFGEQVAHGLHLAPFLLQIIGHRPLQARMGEGMNGVGGARQIAAGELVFALCARLDPTQALGDREIDRLVVADLEMQEGVVFDRAQCRP